MTPRAVGGAGKGGNRGEFQKPKPKFKPKPRPKPAEDEPEGPGYRDRAKERREEANPDYEGDQALFPGAAPGKVPGYAPPGAQDELRQLSVEESKYLGGDMEHTHLVKGLDFALLRKVRAEMKEKEKDDAYVEGEAKKVPGEAKKVPGEAKQASPEPVDDGSKVRRRRDGARVSQRHGSETARLGHRVEQAARPEGREHGLRVGEAGV